MCVVTASGAITGLRAITNERDRKLSARKPSLLNAKIVVQSSRRPTPLCREVVNNKAHIIQHDEYENKVLKDWSEFNFPDTYVGEMDA